MSKLTEIYGERTTLEELQKFAEAQFKTINEFSKQISQLETENKHLQDLLTKSTPIISNNTTEEDDLSSDQEKICKEQLRIYKNTSLERELTLEETRKVEIYAKILLSLKDPSKKPKTEAEKMDTAQLLKLVETNNG